MNNPRAESGAKGIWAKWGYSPREPGNDDQGWGEIFVGVDKADSAECVLFPKTAVKKLPARLI